MQVMFRMLFQKAILLLLEAELAVLDEEERAEFLEELGISQIARDRLVKMCYKTLRLVSFLTVVSGELRAWTVPAGCMCYGA